MASVKTVVWPLQVFLDEVNTSSCLGLFKEIIVDRSMDGEVCFCSCTLCILFYCVFMRTIVCFVFV